MAFKNPFIILLVSCCIRVPGALGKPVSDSYNVNVESYLMKHGYIDHPDPRAGSLRSGKELIDGIKLFQMYAGVPVTGELDDATMKMMALPRCGMADFGPSDTTRRRRRYAVQGSTWKKRFLTYMIQEKGPRNSIQLSEVKEQVAKAFKEWQRVTDLKFASSTDPNADILVRFADGMHEDGYPFDGRGGTLAHGFYPHNNEGLAGDVHFDDDEKWVLTKDETGTDFYWTALHEIGHSLGLDHSNYKDAVMYPFYTGFKADLKLNDDDIRGIRYLYGMPKVIIQTAPPEPTEVTPRTNPPGMPSPCKNASFDAVFSDGVSVTYFFSGSNYWRVLESGGRQGPYSIKNTWKELPKAGIDAAFQSEGNTTFFKGQMCWVYNGTTLLEGPANISKKFGVDSSIDSVDAAFVWGANGKTYLFKGDKYWRFNDALNSIDMGYPVEIKKTWRGVPENVDSAMTWINGKTYFFKGSGFWIFDNVKIKVTDVKPMDIGMYWIKCTTYEMREEFPNHATKLHISLLVTTFLSGLAFLISLLING